MEKIIESYGGMKSRHGKELGAFEGLFFAFSDKQLKEGLEKVKATIKEIVSIGAGGFILKTEIKAFKELFKRHNKELETRLSDEKKLIEALIYELGNHEYCITYDPTQALESLGLEKADICPKVLKKACSLAV